MSDLSDFFAKKDRKKKKAATRTALTSIIPEGKKDEAEEEAAQQPPPPPPKQDDGWIEIEDPRGAQVNTGGRRVQEFRRGVEDKEHNGDGNVPVEKFSGWGSKQTQPPDVAGDAQDTVAQAPSSAFPTLADAANAPQLPVSQQKPSSSSSEPTLASAARRPRFINSDKEKFRKKVAEREASAK